jgi:hypothetical protein
MEKFNTHSNKENANQNYIGFYLIPVRMVIKKIKNNKSHRGCEGNGTLNTAGRNVN